MSYKPLPNEKSEVCLKEFSRLLKTSLSVAPEVTCEYQNGFQLPTDTYNCCPSALTRALWQYAQGSNECMIHRQEKDYTDWIPVFPHEFCSPSTLTVRFEDKGRKFADMCVSLDRGLHACA